MRFPPLLSLCWGFGCSATSAAELEVRDGTHKYGAARLQSGINSGVSKREKGKKHARYFHRQTSAGSTLHSSKRHLPWESFLFVPVRVQMRVEAAWQSLVCRSLSAQHGGDWGHRVDSNLSGLRYQRTGGGCAGRRRETKVSFRERTFSQVFLFFSFLFLDWRKWTSS